MLSRTIISFDMSNKYVLGKQATKYVSIRIQEQKCNIKTDNCLTGRKKK